MKYIQKFYENKEDNLDIEYISNCFIDLIDKGAKVSYKNLEYIIQIEIPTIAETKDINIKEYIDNEKKRVSILDEIDYSLEKVLFEYPDLDYKISSSRFTGIGHVNNTFYITFHVKEENPF